MTVNEESNPLENARHEAFARLVADGRSAAEAYRSEYPDASAATAETNGPKLARETQVLLRVQYLRGEVEKAVAASVSKWVKSKEEWIEWLSEGAQTPVGDIDETSPFAQEVTTDRLGEGESATVIRKKVKSLGKIEAVKLIGSWSGFEKGTEAENKIGDILIRIGNDPHAQP